MSNIWKNVVRWFLNLFGREVVEESIEFIEDKTGWDIPEDTIVEFANRFLPDILGDPNAKLWDGQDEILNMLDVGDVAVEGKRQTGKTLLLTIHAAYKMFREPNTTVVVRDLNALKGEEFVRKILKVVESVKDTFGVEILKNSYNAFTLSNGSKLVLVTSPDFELAAMSTRIDLLVADDITHWSGEIVDILKNKYKYLEGIINMSSSSEWGQGLASVEEASTETWAAEEVPTTRLE